ncbi:AT-hook motif nuclear-localized protein 7-like [Vigna radiata var. radiata]|uniref:AT-hook motif nuclear-localized protein n=1 Tax=Vigna radiata var. radiata TaxID=3916 RepID=A0A3Q0FGX3_VIGRR|nr:AT-hook motif nuclear-localized protein 7-like [Vigna radiata var. radiata]
MEQPLSDTDQFLTLGATSDESQSPKEPASHVSAADNNNNAVSAVNVATGSGSDTELVVALANSDAVGSGLVEKRRRGRPRKSEAVGITASPLMAVVPPPPSGFSDQTKRGRGRPRGSGKLQVIASIGGFMAETAGRSFIPHVLTVQIGENLVETIMSFFEKGPLSVCILSATGAISNVTIREHAGSNHITRFEGTFEILSLSGACTFVGGINGPVRTSGYLSISMAKSDGNVLGGILESALVAACPIQLIMATFKQNMSSQLKRKQLLEFSNGPLILESPNSEIGKMKVPKLTEGEKSCSSPATELVPTTVPNCVADNVFSATPNGVADSATNVHSACVIGVDMDNQAPQSASDDSDQKTSAELNANVIEF